MRLFLVAYPDSESALRYKHQGNQWAWKAKSDKNDKNDVKFPVNEGKGPERKQQLCGNEAQAGTATRAFQLGGSQLARKIQAGASSF